MGAAAQRSREAVEGQAHELRVRAYTTKQGDPRCVRKLLDPCAVY